jgi:hypothetical protein
MAFGNKYKCEWASNNLKGYIYLDQKDYIGDVTILKLSSRDAFRISHVFEGYEEYIIGSRCEFEIINDQANYFDLLPLMYATEGEYKVRVEIITVGSEASLFEGYINCDVVSQKYLKRQSIQIVASSYLSKLKHLIPTKIEDLQKISFIDIIDEILRQTGSNFNIRVNSSLYAKNDILSAGQTLFNKNGFYTEIFWEDNIDRKNSLEILESILTTFNCYLYYFDGKWYIERYEDIWTPSVDYVEYVSGVSYGVSDAGSVVNVSKTTNDLHDIIFTSKSQTIRVIPGCKLIRVLTNTDDGLLLNLTINDFSDASAISGVVPYPDYRTWEYWDDGDIYLVWLPLTSPHNNISNCILRQFWKGGIDYILGNFIYSPHLIEWHRGIYTKFEMTINENSKINIKFKFGIDNGSILQAYTGNLSDYEFVFKYYLRLTPENNFITYNEDNKLWEINESTEANSLQEISVDGDSFDKDNMTYEVNINININDLGSGYYGDQSLVLCIATEEIVRKDTLYQDLPAQYCWYGDVIITSNATIDNDVIDGSINTDFLDKKEIELDLFDIANKNYKSGVLRGTDYGEETERWTTDGIKYCSLIAWIFINKFRLYNSSKQKITSSVFSTSVLRLFSQYVDSEQSNKKFLLMGLVHYPAMDKYEIQLYEYDNNTEIKLIKENSISAEVEMLGVVYNITNNSANANGKVISEGDSEVYERGICWNTVGNPTLADNYSSMGYGPGEYVGNLINLNADTTYYVRAYAENCGAIGYSDNQLEFKTLT